MDSFSKYFSSQIINHMLRNQAFTPPTTVYVALFKSNVGLDNNSGITGEVTGGSYAREAISLEAAVSGLSNNSAEIVFDTATADWGIITHIALVDHASNVNWGTNVNILMWGELGESKNVTSGTTVRLPESSLLISVQ